jgi:hypothetical protein
MMSAVVTGIGVCGPGLPDWATARAVLGGQQPYLPEALAKPAGGCLPPTERRRATVVTRLALDAASEALAGSDPAGVTSVFASSGGEVEIIHGIFEQLAGSDRWLSPTAFHNSVHNAAAGYWSIASGSHRSADSLCAFDDSFGVGLGEALLRCQSGDGPVLLVAYDWPPLFPIAEFRRVTRPFAIALLLDVAESGDMGAGRLTADYWSDRPAATAMVIPGLEQLRLENPAARALPLLKALAAGESTEIILGHGMAGSLRVRIDFG